MVNMFKNYDKEYKALRKEYDAFLIEHRDTVNANKDLMTAKE